VEGHSYRYVRGKNAWVTMRHDASDSVGLLRRLVAVIGGWFPERQFVIRAEGRVSYLSVSRRLQIVSVILLLGATGWATYATVYYSSFDWVLREKNLQIAEARIAYSNVMNEVTSYNARLMAITRNLERSQLDLLSRLDDKPGAPPVSDGADDGDRIRELHEAMTKTKRRQLSRQVEGMEDAWRELAARNATLEHGLASIGSEVDGILEKQGEISTERDGLRTQVGSLEAAIADMRVTQEALIDRLRERTEGTIGQVESIVAITGLDIERLVARIAEKSGGGTTGQGGPYVELPEGSADEDPLDHKVAMLDARINRWQYLRLVVNNLPLVSPVDYYRLASGFGRRRDPVTRRWARHNGVDMSYHLNTPILSPAPGRVVFRGWRGGMGRVIEIDHGMGIRTRYGHLRKMLVKRGQKVGFREKIALLGSSGRSTGPHLHYEILIDGKPVDPLKFIKAGKYAFKG
jgi:murein DD-endopeptidase MepM/ murein hydrolase activator NlpD